MMRTLFPIGIISMALALLFPSGNAFAFIGTGVVGTTTQNPATNAVLVSALLPASGSQAATPSANYVVGINWYCSAAATYLYQVLNASSVAVATITLPCSAGARGMYAGPSSISFSIPDGFTLRVIAAAGFTGFAQAEIYYAIESLN